MPPSFTPPILARAATVLSAAFALAAVAGGFLLSLDTLVGWASYGLWMPTTLANATDYRMGWLSDVPLAVVVVATGSIASLILLRVTYIVASPSRSKS